jgi:hypothetical protein
MKLYKLRFTESDFTNKDGNTWRTDTLDLYTNDQYKNYTSTKSPLGTNFLGNGTYTGLNALSATTSELGYVSDGRFVDTLSRIDILSYSATLDRVATADTELSLSVYSSNEAGIVPYFEHATPESVGDWAIRSDVVPGQAVLIIDIEQHCFFEIKFESEAAIPTDADFELIVSVQIGAPPINGFFSSTRRALDRFPEWMEMREYDAEDIRDLEKATPTKIGSQFINAVSGEWLNDLRGKIGYSEFQKYIETVDLEQKAWVYKVIVLPSHIHSVTGDGIELTVAASIDEFYKSTADEDIYFLSNRSELFSNKLYATDQFLINEVVTPQEEYHVWNSLDDIGLTVDLYRLPSEDNDSFKKRVLDVYINKPGVTVEAFKLALRRELNLWKYSSATPDSFFEGATPEILELPDIEKDPVFFNAEGIPTEEFYSLVDRLGTKYPMTWGLFDYGQAIWDSDGLYHKGFGYIPKQLDATPVDLELYQSGVGDKNDLLLLRPDFYSPEQDFDVTIAVRGRTESVSNVATEINLEAQVSGLISLTTATYDPPLSNFSLEITHTNGSIYYSNIQLTAAYFGGDPGTIELSSYSPLLATPNWPPPAVDDMAKSYTEWLNDQGKVNHTYVWRDKLDNSFFEPRIDQSEILEIKITPGTYIHANDDYINPPDSDYYKLKFAHAAGNLGYEGTANISVFSLDYENQDNRIEFEDWHFEVIDNNPLGYETTPRVVNAIVNKDNVVAPTIVNISHIDWPEDNTGGLMEVKIKIILAGHNKDGDIGAFTSSGLFIDKSDISVNGNSSWDVDGEILLTITPDPEPGEVIELTFQCSTSTGYPEPVSTWESFKKTHVVTGQKANEHGVYRDGRAPNLGSGSAELGNFTFTDADFGLDATQVITWIGVDSVSNPHISSWLNVNRVIERDYLTISNSNSFVERYNGDFSPVPILAKLKGTLNPKWKPYLHSGFFYEDKEDYFMYAAPQSHDITGAQLPYEIESYQGAPVLVFDSNGDQIRQVVSFDQVTPGANQFVEQKSGTDTTSLYSTYKNISSISVKNLTTDSAISLTSNFSVTNEIGLSATGDSDHVFELTYNIDKAFYLTSVEDDFSNKKLLHILDASDGDTFKVYVESEKFNPATPIDLPLNPLYSTLNEGFVFLDSQERALDRLELSISPSKILNDNKDYCLVSVFGYDDIGNPKPNMVVTITDSGGVETSESSVTLDQFGYANFYAQSVLDTTALSATVTGTSGAVSGFASMKVEPVVVDKPSLSLVVDSEQILSDGDSGMTIFGIIKDENNTPIANAVVLWKKGRGIKECFDVASSTSLAEPGQSNISGKVLSDSKGRFSIGPFISQTEPGYWFVSAETGSIEPNDDADEFPLSGDVTYWYEYLDLTNILDPVTLLPFASVQSATPSYVYEDMLATPAFPVNFDEENYEDEATGATPNWLPPTWYPINKYSQYQLGLLGDNHYETSTPNSDYPYYTES